MWYDSVVFPASSHTSATMILFWQKNISTAWGDIYTPKSSYLEHQNNLKEEITKLDGQHANCTLDKVTSNVNQV